jgi:hypothetical protein
MKLESHEAYIVGKWIIVNNRVVADDNCKRIEYLTRNYLKKVKSSSDGWLATYQDPATLLYWELSYPHSELHGGGPPVLSRIGLGCQQDQAL